MRRPPTPLVIHEVIATDHVRPGAIFYSRDPYRRGDALGALKRDNIVKILNLGDNSHSYEVQDGVAEAYPIRLCRTCITNNVHRQEEWVFLDFTAGLRPVILKRLTLWDRVIMSFVGLNNALLGGRRGAVDFYNEVGCWVGV